MGKRGPAAAPTALKLVRGTRPDRVNHNEPKPEGEVTAPTTLSNGARKVWDSLAPDLIAQKILTTWDVDTFAAFCELVVQNRDANADLAENGNRITVPVRELRDGTVIYSTQKNPAWTVVRESSALLVTLGGRFGLNPSDRSALKVGDAGKRSDKERLLS